MMDTIGSDMRIYIIGYSAFDMNGFIRALKDYGALDFQHIREIKCRDDIAFSMLAHNCPPIYLPDR